MRLRVDMARRAWWFGAVAISVAACLGEAPPGTRSPPRQPTNDESAAPRDAGVPARTAASSLVDASVVGVDGGGPRPWPNAASCAPLQRGKAVGCCNPSPELLLCIVYNNANHVVGPYAARILLITATDTQRVVANIAIDLRQHANMRLPDTTVALLGLSVQPWGLDLSALEGCGDTATAATKRMCHNQGKHVWDGHKLVHEAER